MRNPKTGSMQIEKFILFLLVIFYSFTSMAQEDTASINKTIVYAGNLDTDKTDSILYYSRYINEISSKINYPYGVAVAKRYSGRYYEYSENFDSAIIEYNDFAKLAEKSLFKLQQMNAIADIAAVYMRTEQYELAKRYYFTYLQMAQITPPSQRVLSQLNNNLAGTYQYLHNYDSAFFYYQQAIKIDELLKDSLHLAERKSNISEILVPMGKMEMARKYLLESTDYNERHNMTDALWYDYSNLGNLFLLLKDYKKSENYYALSYEQANKTSTKIKLAQTFDGFSKLYQALGQYQKALQYKIQSDSINSLLINENTNKKIAELQEKYQVEKREQQNTILSSELEKQILQRRNITIVAISLSVMATIIAYALYINNKRKNLLIKQNKLINDQKDKLAEMNLEKNSLISMVSHDLKSPIANIQLWGKILRGQLDDSNENQKRALGYILESADYSNRLIKNILNVEQVETGHHKIELEEIVLAQFINEIKNNFLQALENKKMQLQVQIEPVNAKLLSDRLLLKRMLENLISNAIKFSDPQTKVLVWVHQHAAITSITVNDQGPGISKEDQEKLFQKYAHLSNLPTDNESTSGLGLYIVKRIVDELDGQIFVESIVGKGSHFKVVFGELARRSLD